MIEAYEASLSASGFPRQGGRDVAIEEAATLVEEYRKDEPDRICCTGTLWKVAQKIRALAAAPTAPQGDSYIEIFASGFRKFAPDLADEFLRRWKASNEKQDAALEDFLAFLRAPATIEDKSDASKQEDGR